MKNERLELLLTMAQQSEHKDKSLKELEIILSNASTDKIAIEETLSIIKKERNNLKSKKGLQKLGLGSLLLLISFLVTCINFHSGQPFSILMYSLTTFGAILVFIGLYEILG